MSAHGEPLPAWPAPPWWEVALGPVALLIAAARRLWLRPVFLAAAVVVLVAVPAGNDGADPTATHVSFADLAASALVALMGLRALRCGDLRGLGAVVVLPLAGILAASGLATMTAWDIPNGLIGLVRYTEVFALVPLAVCLSLRTRADVLLLLRTLLGLGLVEGAVGVYQAATGSGAGFGNASIRAVGTFGAYDIMAMATVVTYALIVSSALAVAAVRRLRPVPVLVTLGLVAPLVLSLSRGAWIAAVVGVFVVITASRWQRGVALVVAAIALSVCAVGAVGSDSSGQNILTNRLSTFTEVTSSPDRSVQDRYDLWDTAINIWADHPVTGVGIKGFAHFRDSAAPLSLSSGSDISDDSGYRRVPLLSPHNMYLLILSEQGLIGAIAYLCFFGVLVIVVMRRLRTAHGMVERTAALAALGFLASYLFSGLYGDIGGTTTVLSAVLFGLVLRVVSPRPLAPPPRPASLTAAPAPLPQPAPPPAVAAAPPSATVVPAASRRRRFRRPRLPRGRRGLFGTAALVGALSLAAAALGLLRDLTIARYFGASGATDAFIVAWTIPETASPLLMNGAMSFLLVPVFSRALARGGSLRATIADTLPAALAALGALTVAVVVAAPWLVDTLAPGLVDPETAVRGMRVAAVTILTFGLAGYLMAALRSSDVFGVPASVNITWNVGIVLTIVVLHDRLGVFSAALGLAVGGVLMVLTLVPAFVRHVGLPRLRLHFPYRRVAQAAIFLPIATYTLSRQAQVYVERFFGSQLDPGAITHLNYASKIAQIAMLLSVTAASVAFPSLARLAETGSRQELRAAVERQLQIATMLVLPATAFLVVFAHRVVALLFERGEFVASDTDATALAMRVYSLGLVGQVLVSVCVMSLFATRHAKWPPLRAALAGLAATIVFDALTVRPLGIIGLAGGNVVGILLMAALLLGSVRRQVAPVGLPAFTGHLVRCVTASLAAAAVAAAVASAVAADLPPVAVVAVAGLLFTLTFGLVASALGVRETRLFLNALRRRLAHAG